MQNGETTRFFGIHHDEGWDSYQSTPETPPSPPAQPPDDSHHVYNIIQFHNLIDHCPEVRAAAAKVQAVGDLRLPPGCHRKPSYDLLDWLAFFFGFQEANVNNQREHLVLHLSDAQMRLSPPPEKVDVLDPSIVRNFRLRLLESYSSWCSYINVESNVLLPDSHHPSTDYYSRELLYVCLYLLIWGESANLRFLPECISYIFHHMAMELNKILDDYIDENTGTPFSPSISGENAYLDQIVKPIYDTIKAEVECSRNGTAPHSTWRNYDDFNEYFWSKKCFEKLNWPIDVKSKFFAKREKRQKVEKTGFVEQRSFLNIFRNFHRLWIMLALSLQAAIIVAWEGTDSPWQGLKRRDVQVKCLTIFVTWSVLMFLKSLLDAAMQYGLASNENRFFAVRMVLKIAAAAGWIVVFWFLYRRIWRKRDIDEGRTLHFYVAAMVFLTAELLTLVMFFFPCLRKNRKGKVSLFLSWWFQDRIFIGSGLKESLMDNTKCTLFWAAVLSAKFCVSYFTQIKPMIGPSKALLGSVETSYEWSSFFNKSNWFAVSLLWLPVGLIYFMDLQIWYSLFSSFVGSGLGLYYRLGEIRDMEQFSLRFRSIASAIKRNLMPWESLFENSHQPNERLESNEVETYEFALIWNEIVSIFREEDIVCDREVELLQLPENGWKTRVIRWPCLFLYNELLLALRQAAALSDSPDSRIWDEICKNEYRRCAVIEAYDSLKHFFPAILRHDSEEYSIIEKFFQEMDESIRLEKFTKSYDLTSLDKVHAVLIDLFETVLNPRKNCDETVTELQSLHHVSMSRFRRDNRGIDELKKDGLAMKDDDTLIFEYAVDLPSESDEDGFYALVRRLHTVFTSHDSMLKVPENLEAKRRIAFFGNSLFMDMPRAPPVEKMRAFSVLTPCHNEQILFTEKVLRSENDNGISTLSFLQTVYADEWRNFIERMRREGMESTRELWTSKLQDLRLWASCRGQTLARTVRGMMYYQRAIKMLSCLDSGPETSMGSARSLFSRSLSSAGLSSRRDECESMKFTFVVSCENYGEREVNEAEEILYLMKKNKALRVAYVDEVRLGRDVKEYYSVLVRYDQRLQSEVELYRIKLPGPIQLGEGKPENQNHAIIFTRGEAVQTIDANQDNYFEEALKMRNLLEEFDRTHGLKKPTILGAREHIFSGLDSSPAQFMGAQETSFVTLGQRVMAKVFKVRMHYGHPDVFDRFWCLTRGGISKGSRVLNINEDIFAGFNSTLRNGNVTHHEYIQSGKGKDVGLNQISTFEAKIAGGSAEQALTRDVYRLGTRLYFFRMLSFFYTSVGFFFNAWMLVFAFYAYWWCQLYLIMSGIESSLVSAKTDENPALPPHLVQIFFILLGLLVYAQMLVESTVEKGFLPSLWEFIISLLQCSPVFYTFSMGTRAHFFGRTMVHGGAKYRARERNFAVEHEPFTENYRLYARSHFVKAIELGLVITVSTMYSPEGGGISQYPELAQAGWFLVASWIIAPFLFNPMGFGWLKTKLDFYEFMDWIWGWSSLLDKPDESWERWWHDEHDHLRTTSLWGKMVEIVWSLRFFFFQYAIVYRLPISVGSTSIVVYLASWVYVVVVAGLGLVLVAARSKYEAKAHGYYRLVQCLAIGFVAFLIVVLVLFTRFRFLDLFTVQLAYLPTGWGLVSIAVVLSPWLGKTAIWGGVVAAARMYDVMFGVIVMFPVAVLSFFPGVQAMQSRMLFNEAFSRGMEISLFLTKKKHES